MVELVGVGVAYSVWACVLVVMVALQGGSTKPNTVLPTLDCLQGSSVGLLLEKIYYNSCVDEYINIYGF